MNNAYQILHIYLLQKLFYVICNQAVFRDCIFGVLLYHREYLCEVRVIQRSICRGRGGLIPPLVEDDPHTGD